MCNGRVVNIPRMVTIQLEPFLPYVNLALKNSYRTEVWLLNIITEAEHFQPYPCSCLLCLRPIIETTVLDHKCLNKDR